MALENLFDHIEVEDDTAEDFQSVPIDSSPERASAEQQPASYSQPPPPSSGAFPRSTTPPRYSQSFY